MGAVYIFERMEANTIKSPRICLRRWREEIVVEVVAVVAELIGADSDELTRQIIGNDKRLAALRTYAKTA